MYKRYLLGLLLLLVTRCSAAVTSTAIPTATLLPAVVPGTVTLMVFSGRPDPVWSLSPKQDHELRERLAALPSAAPGEFPQGLGYRGMTVLLFEPADAPHEVLVYGGLVQRKDGAAVTWLHDPDHAVELWLLDTGVFQNGDVAALEADLRATILAQP